MGKERTNLVSNMEANSGAFEAALESVNQSNKQDLLRRMPNCRVPASLAKEVRSVCGSASKEAYARCYDGLGCRFAEEDQNFPMAYRCFRESLRFFDNAEAWYQLGLCFLNGEGVPQDEVMAIECWFNATEKPEALHQLACAFGNGDGVDQDIALADELLALAAAAGCQESIDLIKRLNH